MPCRPAREPEVTCNTKNPGDLASGFFAVLAGALARVAGQQLVAFDSAAMGSGAGDWHRQLKRAALSMAGRPPARAAAQLPRGPRRFSSEQVLESGRRIPVYQ